MGSQRLFVAVEVPEAIRLDLSRRLEPWRSKLTEARWVPSGNWHVTLLFLGATRDDRVVWVRERLGKTCGGASAFDTAITALGGFPSASHARVVWAGLEDRSGRMGQLARRVREGLEAEPDPRPFVAHMTVARTARGPSLPEGFVAIPLSDASFTVGELVLFRSHPQRPAPRYEPLARFPLGSGLSEV